MAKRLLKATVYTDGGCKPNPGPGGWGAVLLPAGKKRVELSGGDPATTNNRMELTAALEGLRALAEPHQVELVTDSQYVKNGITEWLPTWRRKGWRTADGSPVKNQDLWVELERELARHQVSWRWIRGHTGSRWNERADRLASAAIPEVNLPIVDDDAVHVFAAAACCGKPAIGAWGVVLSFQGHSKSLSGREEGASGNRMHIQAAVAGLEALRRPLRVHLYTVSDYLKDGAVSWLNQWRARGWKTREGRPVSHRDLWSRLASLAERHEVCWHVASRDNALEEMERAKQLATAVARGERQAETGEASPVD